MSTYNPTPYEINRINCLQFEAGNRGAALAMPKDYTPVDMRHAAIEISYML